MTRLLNEGLHVLRTISRYFQEKNLRNITYFSLIDILNLKQMEELGIAEIIISIYYINILCQYYVNILRPIIPSKLVRLVRLVRLGSP
jgi:hypothetical protein